MSLGLDISNRMSLVASGFMADTGIDLVTRRTIGHPVYHPHKRLLQSRGSENWRWKTSGPEGGRMGI